MLTKSFTILHTLVRPREEAKGKPLTRKQWINADRVVMIIIFLSVIVAAVIFS